MTRTLCDTALLRSGYYVGGQLMGSSSNGRYPICNPATGGLIMELPRCREKETRGAIEVAQQAFERWRTTTAKRRSKILVVTATVKNFAGKAPTSVREFLTAHRAALMPK
jgi:succinate-semialdehyde dehydrogenase / glutarate-semialdehyde dehydrogenase